jgi:ribosomal protein S18 acetylase RimI-like enzyme
MSISDRDAVLALSVTYKQSAFVEPLKETLSDDDPLRECFVIVADHAIVGFFQIDSTSGAQKIPGSLELHEVLVDVKHQGKGLGKAFVLSLKQFLKAEYPRSQSVCLTVNCKNKAAYRLYELGGFVDIGQIYSEGRSGPQHIMQLMLA